MSYPSRESRPEDPFPPGSVRLGHPRQLPVSRPDVLHVHPPSTAGLVNAAAIRHSPNPLPPLLPPLTSLTRHGFFLRPLTTFAYPSISVAQFPRHLVQSLSSPPRRSASPLVSPTSSCCNSFPAQSKPASSGSICGLISVLSTHVHRHLSPFPRTFHPTFLIPAPILLVTWSSCWSRWIRAAHRFLPASPPRPCAHRDSGPARDGADLRRRAGRTWSRPTPHWVMSLLALRSNPIAAEAVEHLIHIIPKEQPVSVHARSTMAIPHPASVRHPRSPRWPFRSRPVLWALMGPPDGEDRRLPQRLPPRGRHVCGWTAPLPIAERGGPVATSTCPRWIYFVRGSVVVFTSLMPSHHGLYIQLPLESVPIPTPNVGSATRPGTLRLWTEPARRPPRADQPPVGPARSRMSGPLKSAVLAAE